MPGESKPGVWSNVAIAAMGLVGTVVAGLLGYQSGAKAVDKDYVQMATTILTRKDTSPELRKWAVDVLGSLSPVPFGRKLEEQLSQSGLSGIRLIVNKTSVPPELAEPCPDLFHGFKEPVPKVELGAVAKEYELCRIKHNSFNELIRELNGVADEYNRKANQADAQLRASVGLPTAPEATNTADN